MTVCRKSAGPIQGMPR